MLEKETINSSLYKQYVNALYNYSVSMGFSRQVCMDAVHDVFCNLYAGNKNIEDIQNIKHYLFSSVKNRLIDIYRGSRTVNLLDLNNLPFNIEVSILDTIVEEDERAVLKANVERLMNLLSDRQREAIYLRYMQELNYEEIALLLGMTPESVRKLVHRGINKMRSNTKDNNKLFLLLLLIFPL